MKRILIIVLIFAFLLTSCAPSIANVSDEIRLNSWSAKLRNGSDVTLVFNGDDADFTINNKDKERCAELSGLCVIDDDELMIYNRADNEPYIFEYNLKGDKLILKYGGGKLKLLKNN